MKLKHVFGWVGCLMALAIALFPAYGQQPFPPQTGFQVSTLGALNQGLFEGVTTIAELKQHGDFGLGTFDGLEGELILLDGKTYQVKADGVAHPVREDIKSPFSVVTFFRKEKTLRVSGEMTYPGLQQQISQQLPTSNLPYAIRIQGTFPRLKVRSVPKQTVPYPPYSQVVSQQQQVFELQNVQGTLVGFRMPQYLKGVNVAGYHFHLITGDRLAGGHLLEGTFLNPTVEVETLQNIQLQLPNTLAFQQATLE